MNTLTKVFEQTKDGMELHKHIRRVSVYNIVTTAVPHFRAGSGIHGARAPDTFSSLGREEDATVATWPGLLVIVLISCLNK